MLSIPNEQDSPAELSLSGALASGDGWEVERQAGSELSPLVTSLPPLGLGDHSLGHKHRVVWQRWAWLIHWMTAGVDKVCRLENTLFEG